MITHHQEFIDLALELIVENGLRVTYLRQLDVAMVDPATDSPAELDVVARIVPALLESQRFRAPRSGGNGDSSMVESRGMRLLLPAKGLGFEPRENDSVVIGTQSFDVSANIETIQPDGVPILFILTLER